MDLDRAYRQLVDAKGRKSRQILDEVTNDCEEWLLTAQALPDTYIAFICRVFSDVATSNRAGLSELMMTIYMERDKASKAQLDRMLSCLESGFKNVKEEKISFSIGDFVARVATPERCLDILRSMNASAGSYKALSGVFFGLNILRKHPGELERAFIDALAVDVENRAALLARDR
jgi:hypothetical protein